jgi:hypothetical protein
MVTAMAVRLGNHLAPMCLQRLQGSFVDVAYSEFASYLLDVDGFALVREAGVILRTKSVGPLLRCFGCAGFFTPLQKVLKQLLGLLVSSRLARR